MVRLLVSTGEVSGDLQGSLLIRALHEEAAARSLPLEVVALGGERMRSAGAELLADTSRLGAIGLLEAVPLILPTLRLQARLRALWRAGQEGWAEAAGRATVRGAARRGGASLIT